MNHLIGLVFEGGLGIPLYKEASYTDDSKTTLIWSLASAITSFATNIIEKQTKGRSELISGHYRLIVYDPFVDLLEDAPGVDKYIIMALQELYDNLEISFKKLIEIHNNILLPLGLDKPDASVGFFIPDDSLKRITLIAQRTQKFPLIKIQAVNEIFNDFLIQKNTEIITLALILADIDDGLITKRFTKDFYEDPAFTELLLSNMVAENPSDAITVWIDRPAPYSLLAAANIDIAIAKMKEIYAMIHIGIGETDFRLLARVITSTMYEEKLRENLRALAEKIAKLLQY